MGVGGAGVVQGNSWIGNSLNTLLYQHFINFGSIRLWTVQRHQTTWLIHDDVVVRSSRTRNNLFEVFRHHPYPRGPTLRRPQAGLGPRPRPGPGPGPMGPEPMGLGPWAWAQGPWAGPLGRGARKSRP